MAGLRHWPQNTGSRLIASFNGATRNNTTHPHGNVFKLAPANGSWAYASLYEFTGGGDGSWPNSKLVVDTGGNIFGTTIQGGSNNNGVLFEITP